MQHQTQLTIEAARRLIREELEGDSTRPDLVGIEAEVFAMAGFGADRVGLFGPGGAVHIAAHMGQTTPSDRDANPILDLGTMGEMSFEPGAQLEHATRPQPSASEAIDDVRTVRTALARSAAQLGRQVVACGTDPWHFADDIPQFLPGPRYKAMADYFQSKGHAGPGMMRNTAALQINLDGGRHLLSRWRTANLLSPFLTASFSTSSSPTAASRRARIWQALDRTRTGFPDLGRPGLEGLIDWCLAADVMMLRRDGTSRPFPPGVRMVDWITSPGSYPPPETDDLRYHLTTLFPEVRLRQGVLEIRAIDALPARLVAAPVVLLVGALYDPPTLAAISAVLEPFGPRCHELWVRAARRGLADHEIFSTALQVWRLALDGAQRCRTKVRTDHLREAEAFVEQFTLRAASPGTDVATLPAAQQFDHWAEPISGTVSSETQLLLQRGTL